MKFPLGWFLAGLSSAMVSLSAVERVPVVDFARPEEVAEGQLSPDGKFFAYIGEHQGLRKLHVADVSGKNVLRLDVGGAGLANGAPKEINDFAWVSDRRLVATTTVWDLAYGVLAVDRDGAHETPLGGYEGDREDWTERGRLFPRTVLHRFYDEGANLLMLDRHGSTLGSAERPDVLMVHTKEGLVGTAVQNPGNVAGWLADRNGAVRVGITSGLEQRGMLYREDANAPWRTLVPLQDERQAVQAEGFDPAGPGLFVAAPTEKKRWGVFSFDPSTGNLGSVLWKDDDYDVAGANGSLIYSRKKDRLLGVRYVAEGPRTKWFDPEMAKLQLAVDKALPATTNHYEGESMDGKRTLWFATSDQDPGAYYLLDTEQHTFRPIARTRQWIKPAQMAPMLAVKYAARDGLAIHGFLTVPAGHAPKQLPLVVLPHGGPWARDHWGFNPWVQLLASRGYAVLQINYRGSPGYGIEHVYLAKHEIGGKIQDDIEDGTRWAIAAGVADPRRIAIFGISYGGYSTLFALGHNPELYRCGISFAGVTDWMTLLEDSDIAHYREASRYWRAQLGDPAKEKERLRAASPVNFAEKIVAPLLIIQGKEDRRVPPDQAKRMIAALEKAGRKPESFFVPDAGHNAGRGKNRVEVYQRIVDFLERELGRGVE